MAAAIDSRAASTAERAASPNEWGMAPIPQADPAHPHTTLFGPNITVFRTTEDQQRTAWGFIKYFTSAKVSVRWALATGYLPIRKSAASLLATWNATAVKHLPRAMAVKCGNKTVFRYKY